MFACGPDCSRHVLTVTSSVDQDVWLSANQWEKRDYPNECVEFASKYNGIQVGSDELTQEYWKTGSKHLSPISFTANQPVDITIEWYWDMVGVQPDWSLTAWGKMGQITVVDKNGRPSDAFPYTERLENMPEETEPVIVVPDPEEPTDPEPPVVIPTQSLGQITFNNWAMEWVAEYDAPYCGSKSYSDFDLESGSKRTVFHNSCDEYALKLTVYMGANEWDQLAYALEYYNPLTGNLDGYNNVVECTDSFSWSKCDFLLTPDSPRVAFQEGLMTRGVIYVSGRWQSWTPTE